MTDQELLAAIKDLIVAYLSKPSDGISAARVTVYGMLAVAAISGIVQIITTVFIIKSERHKLFDQLLTQQKIEDKRQWKLELKAIVSELLYLTEPQTNSSFDMKLIINKIYQAQLMLDLNNVEEKKLNGILNKLGHAVDVPLGEPNRNQINSIHSILIDSAKEIFGYLKSNKEPC